VSAVWRKVTAAVGETTLIIVVGVDCIKRIFIATVDHSGPSLCLKAPHSG
jgi:hypothetical protein